jgi:hypothetical protein
MLPPGVLAGMEVGKERLRGKERGGCGKREQGSPHTGRFW